MFNPFSKQRLEDKTLHELIRLNMKLCRFLIRFCGIGAVLYGLIGAVYLVMGSYGISIWLAFWCALNAYLWNKYTNEWNDKYPEWNEILAGPDFHRERGSFYHDNS